MYMCCTTCTSRYLCSFKDIDLCAAQCVFMFIVLTGREYQFSEHQHFYTFLAFMEKRFAKAAIKEQIASSSSLLSTLMGEIFTSGA